MTVAQWGSRTNQDVTFRVKLVDACMSAALVAPNDIGHITVQDGATGYEEWTDATDDWSSTFGEFYKCGYRSFVVWDTGNNVPSWITVSQPNPGTAPQTWRMNYAPYSATGVEHQGNS
jgi:hypothetical protein